MIKNRSFFLIVSGLLLLAATLTMIAWSASRRSRVIIEWETASELNTAGFYILRGETRENISTRLNSELLPPSSDPLRGKAYQFVDMSAVPGHVYYYLVEEIELSGAKQRFGPIEVKARGGGSIEAVSAALIGGLGLIGLVYWMVSVRAKHRK